MGRLASITRGRTGRPGDMIHGKAPRPPQPAKPPKPLRQQTSTTKKREPRSDVRNQHDQDERPD